jgi:RNA polymerase sigma factor (sigma-70 family)
MTKVQPSAGNVSFEVFYAATAQRVFDSMRRAAAGDKHLAHDVVQDAYLVMLQRWADRCTRSLLDNHRYVVGIASKKLADAYRQRGRFDDLGCVEPAEAVERSGIDGVISDLSLLQAVRDCLARQPPRRRVVGVLFFLEDRGYDEIGEMLDLAPSTVRTHVERLRKQLQRLVSGLGDAGRGGRR